MIKIYFKVPISREQSQSKRISINEANEIDSQSNPNPISLSKQNKRTTSSDEGIKCGGPKTEEGVLRRGHKNSRKSSDSGGRINKKVEKLEEECKLFKMIGPSLVPQTRNEIMTEVKGRLNFFENSM